MSVSVTKAGPYYSSGPISFSSLRSNFAERSSGMISALDLRRNTNVAEENPVVPDSTENEQISTGSNLRLSQFRNSVKRYTATQSGTDDNSSNANEPGFRMGRFNSSLVMTGIDWSGGGNSGRDGVSGGFTGNHTKNIQKKILITGTCGSVQTGQAAAQLAIGAIVHNIRIEVTGSVLGFGGRGGGNWFNPAGTSNGDQDGENGFHAFQFSNVGNNCKVFISSGARVWAGGGGGERGRTGANGANGTCLTTVTLQGPSCGVCPSCPSGSSTIRSCYDTAPCETYNYCCRFFFGIPIDCNCVGISRYVKKIDCQTLATMPGGLGGRGGKGGNARGYNNQSGSTSGEPGLSGQNSTATCSGTPAPAPGRGKDGGRGGNGGNYGENGQEVTSEYVAGAQGKAINSTDGGRYNVSGTINSNTVKGLIYG